MARVMTTTGGGQYEDMTGQWRRAMALLRRRARPTRIVRLADLGDPGLLCRVAERVLQVLRVAFWAGILAGIAALAGYHALGWWR